MGDWSWDGFLSVVGDIGSSLANGIESVGSAIGDVLKSFDAGFEIFTDTNGNGSTLWSEVGDFFGDTKDFLFGEKGIAGGMKMESEDGIGATLAGQAADNGLIGGFTDWIEKNPNSAKFAGAVAQGAIGAYQKEKDREAAKELLEFKAQKESELLRDRYNYDYDNEIKKRVNAFRPGGA